MLKRECRRSVLTVLLSFGLFAAQLLPQAHAHPTDAPDHDGAVEIHRHVASHVSASRHAVVDHEDGEAVWIVAAFLTPGYGFSPAARPTVAAGPADLPASPCVSSRSLPTTRSVSTHDPPVLQPAGLRGPPASIL